MIRTYAKGFYNSVVKNKGVNPITYQMAKQALRIEDDYTTDDDYITSLIDVATQVAADWINADILPTETTLVVWEFGGKTLYIEDNYLSGLTITGTTVDFDVYDEITEFRIEFDSFINMNASVFLDTDLNLTLHYWSGYATMPTPIRQAILIKVADLYDMERNGYVLNSYRNNNVFDILLQPYKKW